MNVHRVYGGVIQDGVHTEGHDVLGRDVMGCETGRQCVTYLDGGHDSFDVFGIEFQDAVEDADFVITEGFFAGAMKLEK